MGPRAKPNTCHPLTVEASHDRVTRLAGQPQHGCAGDHRADDGEVVVERGLAGKRDAAPGDETVEDGVAAGRPDAELDRAGALAAEDDVDGALLADLGGVEGVARVAVEKRVARLDGGRTVAVVDGEVELGDRVAEFRQREDRAARVEKACADEFNRRGGRAASASAAAPAAAAGDREQQRAQATESCTHHDLKSNGFRPRAQGARTFPVAAALQAPVGCA